MRCSMLEIRGWVVWKLVMHSMMLWDKFSRAGGQAATH
jgi:hypothetical protein